MGGSSTNHLSRLDYFKSPAVLQYQNGLLPEWRRGRSYPGLEQSLHAASRHPAIAVVSVHQSRANRCPVQSDQQRHLYRRGERDHRSHGRRALQSDQPGGVLRQRQLARHPHQQPQRTTLHAHDDRLDRRRLCADGRRHRRQRSDQHFRAGQHHRQHRQRTVLWADVKRHGFAVL